MPEPEAAPEIGASDAGAQGGNGHADIDPKLVTPEHIRQLRDENSERRWSEKRLKEENATLKAQLDAAAKAKPVVKPDGSNGKPPATSDDAMAIKLSESLALLGEANQRIEALEKADKEREEKAQKKMLRASLTRTLNDADVRNIDEAIIYLEARGARLADDDRVVIDVTDDSGEPRPVVLNPKSIRDAKVLTDHWFKPVGVGGAGSAAPRGAPLGFDPERAKTDPQYFKDHEKEVDAHLRAQSHR